MQPLPPRIAELADALRRDLAASDSVEAVQVDEAVATMIRLELHLLLPAARDPNDLAWDRAHDRIYRRFFRCVDAVRYPRPRPARRRSSQAPARTEPAHSEAPPPEDPTTSTLQAPAPIEPSQTHDPAPNAASATSTIVGTTPAAHVASPPIEPRIEPAQHSSTPINAASTTTFSQPEWPSPIRTRKRHHPPKSVRIGGRDRLLGQNPRDPDVLPVLIAPRPADARAAPA